MKYAVLHEGQRHTYETIIRSKIPPSQHLADTLRTSTVAVCPGRTGYIVKFTKYGQPDDEEFFQVVEDIREQLMAYEREWDSFCLMMQIWQEVQEQREQE